MKKLIFITLFILFGIQYNFAFAEENAVVCTMDAIQCPDGTWVGRTGPHCEFDCSTHQEKDKKAEKNIVVHPSYVGVAVPIEKNKQNEKKDKCASQSEQFICGQPPIPECLKDDAIHKCRMPMPMPRTYKNKCYLEKDNAEWLHDGKCKGDFSDTKESKEVKTIPENCKTWFDGCNTCVRDEKTKEMLCTMKACMYQETPECIEYFENKIEGGEHKAIAKNNDVSQENIAEEKQIRVIKKIQTKKLLGVFKISFKTELEVDNATGKIIKEKKPWYSFLVF